MFSIISGYPAYEISHDIISALIEQDASSALRGPLPVNMQHFSGLGVDDVDNDATVPPASLEQVVVLVALTRVEGLVEERPRQLLFSMDL